VLGVYFAQARMYDAADRRFMAVDPVKGWILSPQSMVQYTYVLSNPLKYIDPTGEEPNPLQTANPTSLTRPPQAESTPFHPTSPFSRPAETPKNHPSFTGTVRVNVRRGDRIVPIYVPDIRNGSSNSDFSRDGYTTIRWQDQTSWLITDWTKLVATFVSGYAPSPGRVDFALGRRSNADEAALRKTSLLFGAINAGVRAIGSSVTRVRLRATILRNSAFQQRVVIEFGADISNVRNNAGGYYYQLQCRDYDLTRLLRQDLSRGIYRFPYSHADYRISYDSARSSDPYFFYLYKDDSSTWLAYPKKYSGDKIELVGFTYNRLGLQSSGPHFVWDTSLSMQYDQVVIVDEAIRGAIDQKLREWGINM
jgi:RHS repeat-associated protein